ncbi:hypothetical protein GY21_11595 [Cryobacterium roopkundense]|nr:hypothetical protein GY21_11595 [Cryobacterium roopkundense]
MFNSASSVGILLGSAMLAFGIPLLVYALNFEHHPADVTLGSLALALICSGAGVLVWRRQVTVPVRHLVLCWFGAGTLICVWATSGDAITHTFAATVSAVVLLAFAIIPSRIALWYPAVLIPAAVLSLALQPGAKLDNVAMSALLALGTGAGLTWFARSAITADTDWLTGVLNFAGFERATSVLLRDTHPGIPITLCRIDLDGFALVNERHGHEAGDQALVEFTAQLRKRLPTSAVLGRIEGDAFAFLLPGRSSSQAQTLLAGLRSAVMGFSTGIATHDADESASELFGRAGVALYDAKRVGFGGMSIHDGYYASISAVRQGIMNGEFHILYQPCVDMRSGRAVGAEALVRWNHPTRGPISPVEFIPLCEASGSIHALGHWVLEQAVSAAAHWNAAQPPGYEPVGVAVNASARELMTPDYADRAVALCQAAGLSVANLGIEATETDFGTASDNVMVNTEKLRAAGVVISMDDFGTGFSSLERLTRMRLDIMKIDRAFIGTIGSATADAPIADLAIRLGTAMSLGIIAEGVETREQADWLIARGCFLAQGYLYARPLPLDDFVRDWVNIEPDSTWWFASNPRSL